MNNGEGASYLLTGTRVHVRTHVFLGEDIASRWVMSLGKSRT